MQHILIADHQTDRALSLSAQIGDNEYRISVSSDTGLLFDSLCISQFDMILLNLFMEDMNCWEVLLRIRKQHPGYPVLVYNQESPDDRMDDVRESIRMVFGKKRRLFRRRSENEKRKKTSSPYPLRIPSSLFTVQPGTVS